MIRAVVLAFAFLFGVTIAHAQTLDPQNTIYLELKDGRVVIKLRPDLAPKHVEQIKALVRQGFYDGIVFHRVIDGFMAQTGDPTGTGMGDQSFPICLPNLRRNLSIAEHWVWHGQMIRIQPIRNFSFAFNLRLS